MPHADDDTGNCQARLTNKETASKKSQKWGSSPHFLFMQFST
jgi:hypothetical protein